MTDNALKYRLKWIIPALIAWEILFWTLGFVLLQLLGSEKSDYVDHILFKAPAALYLLLLLIPITGIYLYNLLRHNRMADRTSSRVANSILRPVSSFSSFLRFFFFRNAFALLIVAMAQPIYGSRKVAATSESLELVVCLDISNSMNTRDVSRDASRLDIAKRALIQLVNNLHGEKIGLCLFANHAFVHLPLTRDYPAAKMFINEIETGLLTSQGTNIAEALGISADMFSKQHTTKGILLVTDGENHEQDPSDILTKIRNSQLQLIVLGIGTTQGGPVPKNGSRPELGYKTDAMGRTVVSKLNKSFLQKIASRAGGDAHISSSEFPDLSGLLTDIKQMKRTKIDTFDFKIKEERYQYALVPALVFWLLYLLWTARFVHILDRVVK